MKVAVLSDVHGNLEAFRAVIEDLRKEGAERVFFLGDAVGYGANPNECLLLLQDLTDEVVAGNHDYGAVGLTDVDDFNPAAYAAVHWTAEELSEENRAYLRRLPLVRQKGEITLVHATPHDPAQWNYIFTFPEAEAGFQALKGHLAFVGHSHGPLIFVMEPEGHVNVLGKSEADLKEKNRYIINVGSVGQPRDGDPRAAYGLYDLDSKRYLLRRVPYDIQTAQKKILQAGLPPSLAHRLFRGV